MRSALGGGQEPPDVAPGVEVEPAFEQRSFVTEPGGVGESLRAGARGAPLDTLKKPRIKAAAADQIIPAVISRPHNEFGILEVVKRQRRDGTRKRGTVASENHDAAGAARQGAGKGGSHAVAEIAIALEPAAETRRKDQFARRLVSGLTLRWLLAQE